MEDVYYYLKTGDKIKDYVPGLEWKNSEGVWLDSCLIGGVLYDESDVGKYRTVRKEKK